MGAVHSGPFQIKLVVIFGAIWVYLAVIAAVQPFFVDGMIDRMEMSSLQARSIARGRILSLSLWTGWNHLGLFADRPDRGQHFMRVHRRCVRPEAHHGGMSRADLCRRGCRIYE